MAAVLDHQSFALSFTDGRAWALHERRTAAALRRVPLAAFAPARWPRAACRRGQHAWTLLSYGEYRAASTLAHLTNLLVLVNAPLDLISLASTLPQQELAHAEICARVAVAMGGAVHLRYAPAEFAGAHGVRPGVSLARQAHELIVRHCCVAETMSFRLLTHGLRTTRVPLLRAALRALARDEALHSELGWLYLDWCADRLDDAERAHLGRVAAATAASCRHAVSAPSGGDATCAADGEVPASFPPAADADEASLDWISPAAAAAVDAETIATCVRAPLASYGIVMP